MSPESSPSVRMDEAALAWATRLDGGLTPAEHGDLLAWLAENPAHEWRLAHFRQFFARLHGTVPVLLAEGRTAAAENPQNSGSVRLRPAKDPVARARPDGVFARLRMTNSRGRLLAGSFAAAALALGAFWFAHRPEEFATLAAQRQHITLADGSHADLNARTALAVRLSGHDRRVRLEQGEAYFEVAKDPDRPFYVETSTGTVRVTGTKFNVRTNPAGLLEVTVLEGSVAVKGGGAAGAAHEFRLKPQARATVDGELALEQRLTPAATEDTVAWRDGKVVFDDTPLAVAAERFATYHGRTITVAPEVAGLLLGGRYTLDDFDQFLGSLEKTLPVRALRGENGYVRIVTGPRMR